MEQRLIIDAVHLLLANSANESAASNEGELIGQNFGKGKMASPRAVLLTGFAKPFPLLFLPLQTFPKKTFSNTAQT
jgi:hypothetical protein